MRFTVGQSGEGHRHADSLGGLLCRVLGVPASRLAKSAVAKTVVVAAVVGTEIVAAYH